MLKGQHPFKGDNFADYLEPRIERRVAGFSSPCWLWRLTTDRKGYVRWRLPSQFARGKGTLALHRVSYEQFVGPIPDGLVIDHLCRNRACLNPQHLEPVTALENARRGVGNQWANVTECKHGHPLNDENTVIRPDGRRRCLTCRRARVREYQERAKVAAGKLCSVCEALLNPTNVSGFCSHCVNARLAPCEREALNVKVVQIRGRVRA